MVNTSPVGRLLKLSNDNKGRNILIILGNLHCCSETGSKHLRNSELEAIEFYSERLIFGGNKI